jgi:hypothetical protein
VAIHSNFDHGGSSDITLFLKSFGDVLKLSELAFLGAVRIRQQFHRIEVVIEAIALAPIVSRLKICAPSSGVNVIELSYDIYAFSNSGARRTAYQESVQSSA